MQQQVERLGPLAPVVFGLLVVLQEVTVIVPSEPLELAAGYAFGFWEGAFVYLAASVVGCFAIIAVVRFGGDRVLELVLTRKGPRVAEPACAGRRGSTSLFSRRSSSLACRRISCYLAAFAWHASRASCSRHHGRSVAVGAGHYAGIVVRRRRRLAGDRHRVQRHRRGRGDRCARIPSFQAPARRGCGRSGEVGGQCA